MFLTGCEQVSCPSPSASIFLMNTEWQTYLPWLTHQEYIYNNFLEMFISDRFKNRNYIFYNFILLITFCLAKE